MSVFSENLKKLRLERSMKQADISDFLGVSVQSYSSYENGREPNYEILAKLADYFEVSSDYLLGLSKYRNKENSNIAELIHLSDRSISFLKNYPAELSGTLDGFLSNPEVYRFFDELMTYIYALGEAEKTEAAEILSYELSKNNEKQISREDAGEVLKELHRRKMMFVLQKIANDINDIRQGRDV